MLEPGMDRLQQTSRTDAPGRVAASTGMVRARCSQVGSSRDPACAVVLRMWQVWGCYRAGTVLLGAFLPVEASKSTHSGNKGA